MSPLQSACFTGHRALPSAHITPLGERLKEQILTLHREQGVCRFLSGGAVGFDLLCAVTVVNLRHYYPDLRLSMVLPCENHFQGWSARERDLLCRVLDRADDIIYTGKEYDRSCMFVRNRYLVDHSQFCIAYQFRARGGTAYTVNYAKSKGLQIYNLAQWLT